MKSAAGASPSGDGAFHGLVDGPGLGRAQATVDIEGAGRAAGARGFLTVP